LCPYLVSLSLIFTHFISFMVRHEDIRLELYSKDLRYHRQYRRIFRLFEMEIIQRSYLFFIDSTWLLLRIFRLQYMISSYLSYISGNISAIASLSLTIRSSIGHFKCFVRTTYMSSLSCFRYGLSYIPFARRMVSSLMIRLCDTEL
jgi:hypothetical protein